MITSRSLVLGEAEALALARPKLGARPERERRIEFPLAR
jgi:hypothetical protein